MFSEFIFVIEQSLQTLLHLARGPGFDYQVEQSAIRFYLKALCGLAPYYTRVKNITGEMWVYYYVI